VEGRRVENKDGAAEVHPAGWVAVVGRALVQADHMDVPEKIGAVSEEAHGPQRQLAIASVAPGEERADDYVGRRELADEKRQQAVGEADTAPAKAIGRYRDKDDHPGRHLAEEITSRHEARDEADQFEQKHGPGGSTAGFTPGEP